MAWASSATSSPTRLWAAARQIEALEHLQRKVDSAIRRVGQPQDAHKFTPHVTLARLRHPEAGKVIDWLTHHALYHQPRIPGWRVSPLFQPLTSDGSVYAVEQDYRFGGS